MRAHWPVPAPGLAGCGTRRSYALSTCCVGLSLAEKLWMGVIGQSMSATWVQEASHTDQHRGILQTTASGALAGARGGVVVVCGQGSRVPWGHGHGRGWDWNQLEIRTANFVGNMRIDRPLQARWISPKLLFQIQLSMAFSRQAAAGSQECQH